MIEKHIVGINNDIPNFMEYSQEDFINYASPDEHMSDSGLTAKNLRWSFNKVFSLDEVLSKSMYTKKKQWIDWLEQEQKERIIEYGYDSIKMITEYWTPNPEVEPVILVITNDGALEIWDGHHRIGIAFESNFVNVPVILGTEL